MRLHSIEITAFGPFADTVAIDFDDLGADGLFLLHGQTGAGKTSILDAVAFALYGTVPGARAEGRRLLSDHAPAGAIPQICLEATIAGRRLRIERSPEFERPKKRGVGTTKQNAKATLEWLDGIGENLSRSQEIGDVVKGLLGMSAEQFFQVVLLPQGEFAKFLRAASDERGKLLERLFDTTRFGDVEQWFRERRGSGAKALAEQQQAVDVLAAKVAAAAGIEAGADAEPVEWAHRLLADAADVRDSTAAAHAEARDTDRSNRAALDSAVALKERIRRRGEARESKARLDAAEPERAAMVVERDAAHRARLVAVLDREAAGAVADTESAQAELDSAAAVLTKSAEGRALLGEVPGQPDDSDRALIRPRCEQWSSEVTRLDTLIEQQLKITDIGSRRAALEEKRQTAAAELEGVAAERAALPGLAAEATTAVADSEKAVASLPGLREARDRAADALAAAGELRLRSTELEQLEKASVQRHADHNLAHEALLDIRARRIAGMAAELAARLVEGDPCEVCGAVEHPSPAQAEPEAATKDDEERAHAAEQRAAKALTDARAAVGDVASTVAILRQRSGDTSEDDLAAVHLDAVRAHDTAATAAAQLDRRRREVDDLQARDLALHSREREVETALTGIARDDAVLASEADEIGRRIAAAIDGSESLTARRDRLAALVEAATAWLDARLRVAQVRSVAQKRAREAEVAAIDGGFTDLAQARAALRPDSRVAEIERELRDAENRRAIVTAVLAEPEIAALTGNEVVDVDAARAVVDSGAAALESALAAATEAHRRHTDVTTYASRLEQAYTALVPLRDEQAELTALADVVAGGGANNRKMSLRSYVLAARLEEVAESASDRLRRMSGGRYEFVHSDAVGSHGKRGGLGLDIHDEYTGAVRSTKTLSGGESFQASLALALGLADVVAAEAGGVVIDTMFIDEGFGTLDADALDAVMGVLDELRAGGRVVGVVSHVDELRQRIPSRLHVLRGRTGSTVQIAG
ncbi:AAA family ATPase [Rhodococcus sp. NPDC060090]|uniref:AAA family ATPase n=1 Tax=Rhodococcus sp. NPDC060090 TaxID=3347056 RepID=UPI003659684B